MELMWDEHVETTTCVFTWHMNTSFYAVVGLKVVKFKGTESRIYWNL